MNKRESIVNFKQFKGQLLVLYKMFNKKLLRKLSERVHQFTCFYLHLVSLFLSLSLFMSSWSGWLMKIFYDEQTVCLLQNIFAQKKEECENHILLSSQVALFFFQLYRWWRWITMQKKCIPEWEKLRGWWFWREKDDIENRQKDIMSMYASRLVMTKLLPWNNQKMATSNSRLSIAFIFTLKEMLLFVFIFFSTSTTSFSILIFICILRRRKKKLFLSLFLSIWRDARKKDTQFLNHDLEYCKSRLCQSIVGQQVPINCDAD